MANTFQDLSLEEIWHNIEKAMNENPEAILGINAIYQYNLKGEDETIYQLQLLNGSATVFKEHFAEPDCILIMREKHFKFLLLGELSGPAAFMTGKLKVKGNIGLALKLDAILGKYNIGRIVG